MREIIDSLRQEIEALPSTMQEDELAGGVMGYFGLTEEAILEMDDEDLAKAILVLAQTGLIEGAFKAGKLRRAVQAVKTFAARSTGREGIARKQSRKSAALAKADVRRESRKAAKAGTHTPEGALAVSKAWKAHAKAQHLAKKGGLVSPERLHKIKAAKEKAKVAGTKERILKAKRQRKRASKAERQAARPEVIGRKAEEFKRKRAKQQYKRQQLKKASRVPSPGMPGATVGFPGQTGKSSAGDVTGAASPRALEKKRKAS
jgi:hypothetical protein